MWSPSAPLSPSSTDGFMMNETIQELIKSSLKMLLLTNPGERVMHPTFGVGLKTFLFERFGQDVYSKIQTRIRKQVATYLPPVKILNIEFDDSNGDQYQLGLRIEYVIVNLGTRDWIDVFV